MKYNTLPGTELAVSEACLGTMTWGEQNTQSQAHEQLDYAVAHGINFIDTAEMYPVPPNGRTQGHTETMLGHWLAKQQRDKLIVATKVAGPGRRDWIRSGRTDLTRDVIEEACGTSLARASHRLHRPLPDPLAAAQRSQFGALEFDPAKERAGPSIREQVEGMAALVRAARSATTACPTRRPGRVRVPPHRQGARASRAR